MDSYNFAVDASDSTHAPSPSRPAPSCRAPGPGGILFYGDPHGCFEPLIAAADALKPAAVVLLGDCDLPGPLSEVLAPILAMGSQLHWIAGNHDTDNPHWYRRLTDAPGDLHGRVANFGGLRVAGLSGVFRTNVMDPRCPLAEARWGSRAELLTATNKSERFDGGLPLRHRATIFPEDLQALGRLRYDVLVAHEAPSSHPHGWAALDDLAAAAGARLIVHGHHHHSYTARLPNGIAVRGLAIAEPWYLEAADAA